MPEGFQNVYPSTRVILDGTEILISKTTNSVGQQASFSTYKIRNTLKVVVGASPGGLITFCSPAYGGSVSDRAVIERSDLLQKCDEGDSVMAVRKYDTTHNLNNALRNQRGAIHRAVLHIV